MRMAWRRTAVGIAALTLAALGCAARGHSASHSAAEAAAGAPPASSDVQSAGSAAGARVTEAAFAEDADGARIVLSANAPLLYTAYEPRPDLLILDLSGVGIAENFTNPAAAGTLVSSVRVEPILELGKQLTRVTIAHREGARYDVRSAGQGLAVAFEPAFASPAARIASQDLSVPPRGEFAHALEEVRAAPSAGEVTISLLGDGVFQPKEFVLENPPRLVIDLPGVRNEVRRRVVPVKSGLVSRVRISQFQSAPDLVTRVVLDLARPLPHALRLDGERLAVVVGGGAAAIATTQPSRTTVAPATPASKEPVKATSSPPPAPVSVAARETPASSAPRETKPAQPEPAAPPPSAPAEREPASSVTAAPAAAAPPPSAVPEKAPERIANAAQAPAAAAVVKPNESSAAAPEKKLAPPPAPPSQSASRPLPARQARRGSAASQKPPSREEALFEAAAAVLQQEEGAHPESSPTPQTGYQPRTIVEGQSQFTGEPISLDLKDADIKDVFRTISQLTQLNIVVDPEVKGTVTVQLEDVPWDQALDIILKQNSLGYVLENNIMRIATTAKLQAEQSDRARLAEARQAAEPTRTVIKKLSYARAQEITPSLKSVMSKRGDIVIDARTNTLIIREIPTYLPAVLQLIENLDTATPQVMIESRIVETTKSLGRSLGINWGFSGVADVAHGNPTGLVFPNIVDFRNPTPGGSGGGFRVGLQNGPSVIGVRLGNIIDSFSLDIALTAAENQGLLKIISSPKVAALTNTAASIQSGVQIPVQTNVNNTTTVIYVDATLKLTVTPQITNEGTILLDVAVSKREPAVALNLSLGQNVPLTVREYRGQVLVRDGGTTVIGGIFQINDQDQNNMIPGLWKIPILGNLFRNKTRTEKHDELLIFITPRILRQ